MSLKRLCIDGFNLGLPKGSGIATYALNLNLAQDALGYETQILLGPPRDTGAPAGLDEALLFDASAAPNPSRKEQQINDWKATRGVDAALVARTGQVVLDGLGIGQTRAKTFWSARDVFHTANRAYAHHGKFVPVRLGGPDRRGGADLTHWTCTLPMRVQGAPNVYTIHDLVPLRLPHTTLDNKRNFHALCTEICRTADHVVTVSEATRQDVIRTFGIAEDRITNTYQAVGASQDLAKSDDAAASDIENVFGLPRHGYFLFFGAIEPKKNLARLIEAYLASGVAAPLVVVGPRGWLDEGETQLLYDDVNTARGPANGKGGGKRVRVYDYLPRGLLVSLVRGARAVLFPSLYEGFGLPVLESLSLGVPVLTSTAGALPEVAGEAALMVDPYNVDAIRDGIAALDADADLRADLSAKARGQAALFSRERYQDRLADLYRRLL